MRGLRQRHRWTRHCHQNRVFHPRRRVSTARDPVSSYSRTPFRPTKQCKLNRRRRSAMRRSSYRAARPTRARVSCHDFPQSVAQRISLSRTNRAHKEVVVQFEPKGRQTIGPIFIALYIRRCRRSGGRLSSQEQLAEALHRLGAASGRSSAYRSGTADRPNWRSPVLPQNCRS